MPALPLASPKWMRAVPMEFASSAALTVWSVSHPHFLLCLPDSGREKEQRFKAPSPVQGVGGLASTAEVEELNTHVGT